MMTAQGFDALNRLTNVVQLTNGVTAASVGYTHDAAGRLDRKTYGNGDVVAHTYDLESRLLRLAITNGATPVTHFTYGWNAVGNLLALTNQGTNLFLYGYDAADQLTNETAWTVGLPGGSTNGWHYDAAGNWRNAGAAHQWFYNADNELLGRSATGDTNWAITVTGEVAPGPASNKWYNAWAQCRGVTAPVNPTNGTFVLANVPLHGGSNELVVTVTDAGTNRWTTNRWVRKDAAEYFLYDGNGNLTNWVSGGTNWVYEWDWADRLVRARSNGVVMLENWYDAAGRRVAKRERVGTGLHIRQYVWDGWESVALLLGTSGAMLESWTRGAGLAGDIGTLVAVTHHGGSTPGTYYTHHDHRGDIILTRSGTSTVGRYDYSAFGTLKSQVGPDVCRFKFSSKERDPSTGWSYYGYRYYAPAWQRWVSADPIGEAGGINVFTFAGNSPLKFVDSLGLSPASECQQDCWDEFGDFNTVSGFMKGVLSGLLQEILTGNGISTKGGGLKKICAAGGGLTRFGRFLRWTAIWGIAWEVYDNSPRLVGLMLCLRGCPDCGRDPGAYYDGCTNQNDPPTSIIYESQRWRR